MDDTALFDDVFCIPYQGQYIIYFPLRGMTMLGNRKLVNTLYQARCGDQTALEQLGISAAVLSELFESEHQLMALRQPKEPPPFQPTSVSLFLTTDCTLRCLYCYAEGGKKAINMTWETITGVLTQVLANVLASQSSHMNVNFHGGGDVSAAWDLLVRTREYLSELTAPHGIHVTTSVGLNGILNSTQREWVVRNIDGATVSLDGPPDIQNALRPRPDGGASFEQVSETLQAFDAAHFRYGLRSTITAESIPRLEEMITYFCEHFGALTIKAEPMYPRGRAANSNVRTPDAAMFVEHFRRARKIAAEANRELIYSGARTDLLTSIFCQAAGDSCAITPQGWITSCYEVLSPSDALADVFFYGQYDPQRRQMVVDDERRQRLFSLSVLQKPFCAKCFCKWHCAGDCPAKALHFERTLAPDVPDRCYINRELTKDQLVEMLSGDQIDESQP